MEQMRIRKLGRSVQQFMRCTTLRSFLPLYRLLILLCSILLLLSCGRQNRATPVAAQTLSMHELYPSAEALAEDWKEDAYLVYAMIPFDTGQADEYRHANFSFRSPSTDIIGLSLWYDPETDSWWDRWLSIAKVDPKTEPEIRDSDWSVDSVEALEIAQAHGGAEFLAGRPSGELYLRLRLETQQEAERQSTVWQVVYRHREASEHLYMVIDAQTGEVIDVEGSR